MNPLQMKINQIINSNPQAKQFYETMKGKSPADLLWAAIQQPQQTVM